MTQRGRTSAEIFWSGEDRGWIAVDKLRPGCSAFGITEQAALRELQNARRAWDDARALTDGELATPKGGNDATG